MKKIFSIILLLCTVALFASCEKEDQKVSFSALIANGSESTTTTTLTLVFDKAIEGLSAENITLVTGETGASKGSLTAKENGVYELAVSGITKAGNITVAVSKTGYTITPASKEVDVKFVAPTVGVEVAFNNLTANGSVTATTTTLTLSFNKAIEGLSAEDITLTAGETGATKGTLTDKSNGVYELAVSGITKAGVITVAVAKTGYTISPASKSVSVNLGPIAVGNFYYSDKTYSSTYNSGKSCIGIVFWINPSEPTKGKIISLEEVYKTWSTEYEVTDATSETDGAANTDKVLAFSGYTADKYPAFAWCAAKRATGPAGIKWYIPAIGELKDEVYANKDALNISLKAAGKLELGGKWYWSSTETSRYHASPVSFGAGSPYGHDKDANSYLVRVVSAF